MFIITPLYFRRPVTSDHNRPSIFNFNDDLLRTLLAPIIGKSTDPIMNVVKVAGRISYNVT
jgi:hypothetical protein